MFQSSSIWVVSGSVKPIVERVYPFGEAGDALRHLIEDRPFWQTHLEGMSDNQIFYCSYTRVIQ
jgi:hypothetical protein